MRPLASRIGLLHGEGALAVYARARELERQGRSIVHLELGEPDFHPAGEVIEAAKMALDAGRDRYCPALGLPALREALAAYLNRTRGLQIVPENVVVFSGCKLALFLAMMALIEPGDEVVYPEPGFPIYPSMTRAMGGTPAPFSLIEANSFQPDLDQMARRISLRTRLLILNSPNNPTGTVYSRRSLEGISELARRHDFFVISDEIYARIVYGAEFVSIASLPGMAERTIIIDGFSKSFAMTGWRLGFAVAPPEVVKALDLLIVNSITCASEFIQWAAVEALRDRAGYTETMVAEYARRRALFVEGVNRVPGFRCAPPEGAFYAWVHVAGTRHDAAQVGRRLLEEAGVAAIPGEAFGPSGAEYLRFSFAGAASELTEALNRISRLYPAGTSLPAAAGTTV